MELLPQSVAQASPAPQQIQSLSEPLATDTAVDYAAVARCVASSTRVQVRQA